MTLEELERKVATMETKWSERDKAATARETVLKEDLDKANERISKIGEKPKLPRWLMPALIGIFTTTLTAFITFVAGYSRLAESVDNLAGTTIPAISEQVKESDKRIEEDIRYLRDKVDRIIGTL